MATTKKYLGTTALRRLVSLFGTRMKSLETNVASNKTSLSSLGTRTARLETYGDSLISDMQKVKTRLSAAEAALSNMTSAELVFAFMWEAAGGVVNYAYEDEYDPATLYVEGYYLNDVTLDFTEAQKIFADREALSGGGVRQVRRDIPTNFVMPSACGMRGDDGDWAYRFLNCAVEVAAVPDNVAPARADGCFWGCAKLTEIRGRIRLNKPAINCANMFMACPKLQTVHLNQLACDISFASCPLLSDASIREMVDNAKGEAAITVTVHAQTLAKVRTIYGGVTVASKKITFRAAV